MAKESPTQRTLKWLREDGFKVGITEKWNPHAKIRQDLFGFIDLVAVKSGHGILGVQTTSGANHSTRRQKILESEEAHLWLACGGHIAVVSWAKQGARGKRKVWTMRWEELNLSDFGPSTALSGGER